jgi:hypothetical protein
LKRLLVARRSAAAWRAKPGAIAPGLPEFGIYATNQQDGK